MGALLFLRGIVSQAKASGKQSERLKPRVSSKGVWRSLLAPEAKGAPPMPIWGHNGHNQRPSAELGKRFFRLGRFVVSLGVNQPEEAFGSGACLSCTCSHACTCPMLSVLPSVSAQWP